MAKHLNFFESLAEAVMRLRGTFVLYDGEPCHVLAITNHKPDGIFRIYMEPMGGGMKKLVGNTYMGLPTNEYSSDFGGLGPAMDEWMTNNPQSGILRKRANSPHFNKFRPFPLGMCNDDGKVLYLERSPNRRTEQGLTQNMISRSVVSLKLPSASVRGLPTGRSSVSDIFGPSFKACVQGTHPSVEECLSNLTDPEVTNEAAAFHRQFALVRGPMDMLFLAYKEFLVGLLVNSDLTAVKLDRKARHVAESVAELGLFRDILF